MPEDNAEAENPAFSAPRVPNPEEEEEDTDGENYEEVEEELVRTLILLPHAEIIEICQDIDVDDLNTLDALLPKNSGERKTLSDLIFAKLESGETGGAAVVQKVRQGIQSQLNGPRHTQTTPNEMVNILTPQKALIPK